MTGQGLGEFLVFKSEHGFVGGQLLSRRRHSQPGSPDLADPVFLCIRIKGVQALGLSTSQGHQEDPPIPLRSCGRDIGDAVLKIIADPGILLGDRLLPGLLTGGSGPLHPVQGMDQQVFQPCPVELIHLILVIADTPASQVVLDHEGHRSCVRDLGGLYPAVGGRTVLPCPLAGKGLEDVGLPCQENGGAGQDGNEDVFDPVDLPAGELPSHTWGPPTFSSMRTVVPGPSRSTRLKLPSWRWMISWAIDRPRPVPPDSLDRALSTR